MRAGAAEAVITPPLGTPLMEPRGVPARRIHDDLYARALAFSDGTRTLAVVSLDLLGLSPALVEAVRREAAAQAGLLPAHVMLSATHTHSAPLTLDCCPNDRPKRDRAWETAMVRTVGAVIAEAVACLEPAALAVGRAPVQIGVNRRVSILSRTRMEPNPHGPVIPWVDVMNVTRTDGTLLAVLYSHAAHPVTVHESDALLSADFPGAAARAIRQRLGEDVVPLFIQGCAGDINVRALAAGVEACEAVGAELAAAVIAAVGEAHPLSSGPLRAGLSVIELPLDMPSPDVAAALLERVRESVRVTDAAERDPRVLDDQWSLLAWAERLAAFGSDAPRALTMPLQALVLAPDCVLLGLAHEPFSGYHAALTAVSPFAHTFVFGYANGSNAYLPTAEAFYLGGYEAFGANKLFGLPPLTADCERLVIDAARDLLQRVSVSQASD
jgi:hypothetical protein